MDPWSVCGVSQFGGGAVIAAFYIAVEQGGGFIPKFQKHQFRYRVGIGQAGGVLNRSPQGKKIGFSLSEHGVFRGGAYRSDIA